VPILGSTYVAFESKVTMLDGGSGVLFGGQGGWVVDPRLLVGFAGYGLASGIALSQPGSMQLAYGGVRAGYVVAPKARFHLTLSALAGVGSVGMTNHDPATGAPEGRSSPVLLALEPEIEAEMNVLPAVRLALSGSYRYLGNPELPGLGSRAVSGLAAGFAVKVGTF
jgi:hypothetical protein